MPDDANRLHEAHAPTPFSAEEICKACAAGRTIRHAIESGTSKFHRVTRFGTHSADGCEISVHNFDLMGKAIGAPSTTSAKWKDLQRHASFPAALTTIEPWTGDTAFGSKSGWKYSVRAEKNGKVEVSTFIFARDLPGPPIEYTQTVDGLKKYRMVMIGDKS